MNFFGYFTWSSDYCLGLGYISVQTRLSLNFHKLFWSYIRVYPVVQICPNSIKIVSSRIRPFAVAQMRPNSHKIVYSCIEAFCCTDLSKLALKGNWFQLHRSVFSHCKVGSSNFNETFSLL